MRTALPAFVRPANASSSVFWNSSSKASGVAVLGCSKLRRSALVCFIADIPVGSDPPANPLQNFLRDAGKNAQFHSDLGCCLLIPARWLRIAQRFNAGNVAKTSQVPKERLIQTALSRPIGTCPSRPLNPTLKHGLISIVPLGLHPANPSGTFFPSFPDLPSIVFLA